MGTEAQANDEWLELYNSSSQVISIDGWKLLIVGDNAINLSGVVSPHGYHLLERTSGSTVSDVTEDYAGSFGRYGLNNAGETLTLVDGAGTVIDEVDCKNGWFSGSGVKGGPTMERKNPNELGNDPANWATFNGLTGVAHDAANNSILGTPRARNSVAGN